MMRIAEKTLRIILTLLFVLVGGLHSSYAKERIVRIGTGSILEAYYSMGLKICRYIESADSSIDCQVVPTNGSIDSLMQLNSGDLDFAFTQANFAQDALKGTGYFKEGGPSSLVQHIRLHNEIFTVIVKDDDHILLFDDIEGKKISNGPPQSDSSATYKLLSEIYNFKVQPEDVELSHEKYAKQFCKGNIDAILMMSGHPNALVSHIANRCDCEFAKISEKNIDKLLERAPEFSKIILRAHQYPDISGETITVGVPAIFVSKADIDPKIVQSFIVEIEKNVQDFRSSHAVLYDFDDAHFLTKFVLPKFNPHFLK